MPEQQIDGANGVPNYANGGAGTPGRLSRSYNDITANDEPWNTAPVGDPAKPTRGIADDWPVINAEVAPAPVQRQLVAAKQPRQPIAAKTPRAPIAAGSADFVWTPPGGKRANVLTGRAGLIMVNQKGMEPTAALDTAKKLYAPLHNASFLRLATDANAEHWADNIHNSSYTDLAASGGASAIQALGDLFGTN